MQLIDRVYMPDAGGVDNSAELSCLPDVDDAELLRDKSTDGMKFFHTSAVSAVKQICHVVQ